MIRNSEASMKPQTIRACIYLGWMIVVFAAHIAIPFSLISALNRRTAPPAIEAAIDRIDLGFWLIVPSFSLSSRFIAFC